MVETSGALSLESINVFAVLRSWLHAEQDIGVLGVLGVVADAADAADAVTRRRDLDRRGEAHAGAIDVVLDQPLLRAMEVSHPGLSFRRLDADPVGLPASEERSAHGPAVAALTAQVATRSPNGDAGGRSRGLPRRRRQGVRDRDLCSIEIG